MHTRQTTDLIRGQSGPSLLREKKRDAVFVIVSSNCAVQLLGSTGKCVFGQHVRSEEGL